MTWQEQLRKLDEDFSSGRVSADNYRVQRDQILSAAAAAPQGGNGQDGAERTQIVQPGAQTGAEATQIVRPVGEGGAPDGATQVVQPQAGGIGGQQGQQAQQEDALWGGDQFPPIAPPTEDEDWVTQGPESDSTGPKKHTGLIIGAVAGVVLLALIAIGAIFLINNKDDHQADGTAPPASTAPPAGQQQGQAPAGQSQAPAPKAPANPNLKIGKLPGKPETHPEVTSFQDVEKQGFLNEDELTAYDKAGAADATFQVQHLPDGTTAPVLLTSVNSGSDGAKAAKALQQVQVGNGAKKDKKAPKGVLVTDYSNKKMGQVRGHYVSGSVVVRIEATNPKKGIAAARKDFITVFNAQKKALPVDAS